MGGFGELWRALFGKSGERAAVRYTDELAGVDGGGNLEQAVPTLAAVLDALGEHAFDLDSEPAGTVQQRFTAWARHVEAGSAPPERTAAPTRRGHRDWAGLRAFVGSHRRHEKQFVTQSGKELRDALWTFVQRLSHSFALDKSADTRVGAQLGRLRSALDQRSVDDLRRQVLDSVEKIESVVEERAERHRRELESTLGELDSLRAELNRARREANVDPLTKLYNRRLFDEQLRALAATRPLTGIPASLLMIDIDHFKKINDSFGHPAGDEVLRQLADCMVRTLPRKSDFVARYGGEEFAVIFQNDGHEVARALAERLMTAVRALAIVHESRSIAITISGGLAEVRDGESPDEWLARADEALYDAKKQGRDRLVVAGAAAATIA